MGESLSILKSFVSFRVYVVGDSDWEYNGAPAMSWFTIEADPGTTSLHCCWWATLYVPLLVEY